MTGFKIVDSSPQVASLAVVTEVPFDTLEVGKSLVIELDAISEGLLRTKTSRRNKKGDKTFRVIKHGEPNNCYEVARIK